TSRSATAMSRAWPGPGPGRVPKGQVVSRGGPGPRLQTPRSLVARAAVSRAWPGSGPGRVPKGLARLLGPEVLHELGVALGIGDLRRDDHDVRVLRLVVPERARDPGGDTHGDRTLDRDHLVVELRLEPARDEEVDLLLRPVPVPVAPLAAGVL